MGDVCALSPAAVELCFTCCYAHKQQQSSLIILLRKKSLVSTHFVCKCIINKYGLLAEAEANGNCIPTYGTQNAALKPPNVLFQQTCNMLEQL